jgi:hypothetical protein
MKTGRKAAPPSRRQIAANAIVDRALRASQELSEPEEPGAKPDQRTIEYRSRLFRLVEQLLNRSAGSLPT